MGDAILRSLAIQFDRKDGVYQPGEILSGKVIADFTQSRLIRGLRVVISGESAVQWFAKKQETDPDPECQPVHQISSTEVMIGREEYFSASFYLLGNESASSFVLPAGQMAYKFKFQLPDKIPCSFEHQNAYVRYTFKAVFRRPSERDLEVKSNFRIVSPYDLNKKLDSTLNIRDDTMKNFFCSCICPTGRIYLRLSVPFVGFVPGQMIPVTVNCENESTVDVTKIKVSLLRNLVVHAKSPHWSSKSEDSVVAETKRSRPFTNNSEECVTILLKVPQLPPTGLEHCGLIDVDYVLRIVVCFSGMHFSVKRRFPVLIGTVPLLGSVRPSKLNVGHPASSVVPNPSVRKSEDLPSSAYNASLHAFGIFGEKSEPTFIYRPENSFASRNPVYDCSPHIQSLILP